MENKEKTHHILFAIPKADKEAIVKKAKSYGLTTAGYCRFILNQSLKMEAFVKK